MRRLSNRKRNKINFKNIHQKAVRNICILTILIVLFVIIYFYFFKNLLIKNHFEKQNLYIANLNEETIFSLDKIVLFSSATAKANELNNAVWNLDISQFTDIGIYLNNISNNDISKNIIKDLYIDNIYITTPEYGTPCLYQKSIEDFGKCSFSKDKILSDKIDFTIKEMDTELNSSNNEVYNNLSTPITLGFYNKSIKTDFLNSDYQIEYNGKILKRASIPKTSIECNVSFCIHIVNELEEHYICNVDFSIPFEENENSIYEDGYITKEMNNLENYKFLRLK